MCATTNELLQRAKKLEELAGRARSRVLKLTLTKQAAALRSEAEARVSVLLARQLESFSRTSR